MPKNSNEYDRHYRSLRKNERKLEISMILKLQREIKNLRKSLRKKPQETANVASSKEDSYNKKEDKEVREKDSKKETKSRGTRLPLDWQLTPERRQKAVDCVLDPDLTFTVFCNHWWSKPGRDGIKLDWDRTWHNWCLNDRRSKPNGSHATNGSGGNGLPKHRAISEAEAEDIFKELGFPLRKGEDLKQKL